uniref:Uncharacterized protein n=1 Tax=Manihot esculenta TaxID=3983 RepID=A0A2C9WDF5_MANES
MNVCIHNLHCHSLNEWRRKSPVCMENLTNEKSRQQFQP